MIRIFSVKKKDKYEIIAVADHQKDLNNLRLMSYDLYDKDKVTLIKSDYGGPYLTFKCDEFKTQQGDYDLHAINERVKEWQKMYN